MVPYALFWQIIKGTSFTETGGLYIIVCIAYLIHIQYILHIQVDMCNLSMFLLLTRRNKIPHSMNLAGH